MRGLLSRQRAALTFRNWQSILNFDVSLPNLSKKDVKGLLSRKQPLHTSPNGGANVCELSHTFLRAMRASPHCPRREREKISFPSLRIHPFLLIVLASVRTKRLLQAREIRRIGFSVAISYPLRVSTELKKALLSATESKAERTALLCEE